MNQIRPPFGVTPAAAARIAAVSSGEPGRPPLRVEVLAGGCNGFQYSFAMDPERRADDEVISQGGATVLVDAASMDLLAGAVLDYEEGLMGSFFRVRNPNALTNCGCGTSFSVD